jgi:DNA polymerase III subunit epsilon
MRAASDQQLYERAAWLRRRLRRLGVILERLGGVLEATHSRARLVLAAHPVDRDRQDAFWLVGGRLVDWGSAPEDTESLEERTQHALTRGGYAGELGAHVPPDEIDELRIIATYLSSHPDLPQVMLERRELANQMAAR